MNQPRLLKTVRAMSMAAGIAVLVLSGACSKRSYSSVHQSTTQSQAMWNRVGTELAGLVPARLKGDGRILLLRSTTNTSIAAEQDAIEAAFKKSVKVPASNIDVIVLPDAPRTPAQIAAMMPALPAPLRSAWLSNVIGAHKSAALVVSLVGEPDAPPAGGTWPPVICFAPAANASLLKQLITSGVVSGAVAVRHADTNKGEKDWFEIRYTVLTKDNLGAW